jgi:hypothetical protein
MGRKGERMAFKAALARGRSPLTTPYEQVTLANKYSPDQQRDDKGRFATEGAAGEPDRGDDGKKLPYSTDSEQAGTRWQRGIKLPAGYEGVKEDASTHSIYTSQEAGNRYVGSVMQSDLGPGSTSSAGRRYDYIGSTAARETHNWSDEFMKPQEAADWVIAQDRAR